MPKALQHTYPRLDYPPGLEVGNDEPREVWEGAMRVVSAKRARVLRKRGVPLMPLHAVHTVATNRFDKRSGYSTYANRIEPTTPNGRARYAWFECKDDAEARRWRRAANCYETWREAEHGTRGRKHELATRLEAQRSDHAARRYFARAHLYAGVIHENVLNPQLDLYAAALRSMQIETATGAALDALCNIPFRPEGMTDAELRTYADQGYVLRVGEASADDRAQRKSPPVTLYVQGYEASEPFVHEPSYAGAPHADCDCNACRPWTY